MKASEARELLEKSSKELDAQDLIQYNEIMNKIRAQIKENLSYDTWYYRSISERIKSRLLSDGYKLTDHSNQRDGTMYNISWEN